MIMSMENENGYQVIKARTPLAETDKLFSSLRSVSQGKAKVRSHLADYAPVPLDVQKRLIDEYQKTEVAENH
jgi:elongation factor G